MSRNVGMGILRMFSVIGGVCILAFVVLVAGTAFMPGTKIGHVFGASAEALAGKELEGRPLAAPVPPVAATTAASPDAGTGPAADAGTGAATAPGEQGGAAPAGAQGLPEQQGR
ncbi:hypothetical protein [Hyalangium sp.]|uniref:hypothetical protein n=1 Tax=Hyalangium sp. TaxID=2028555 RepID=UPI002D621295|nr:hypothetical protein [Hyalangium sp.]HYI01821.1 hypothetical protein [Hyalangium sp.]